MADGRGFYDIRLYSAYNMWMEHKNIFGRGLTLVPSKESLNETFALHLLEIHSSCKLCNVPPCATVTSALCAAEAIPGKGLPPRPIESPVTPLNPPSIPAIAIGLPPLALAPIIKRSHLQSTPAPSSSKPQESSKSPSTSSFQDTKPNTPCLPSSPTTCSGEKVNNLNTMGKSKKGIYEEPQPAERVGCQTDCSPGRGENMQGDYREDSEAEEKAGEQPAERVGCPTDCSPGRGENMQGDYREDSEAEEQQTSEKHDNKTISIKEEDLDDYETLFFKEEDLDGYYGEGDKPKEKLADLLPPGDVEYDTTYAKEDGLEDEWIEDDKSEGHQLADEDGLPYHVLIKEELSDDDYLENDYQGDGEGDETRNVDITAHSSSKQDGSSSKEDCNEIPRLSPQITRKRKDGSPCNESETTLTVSEATVCSRSDMSLSKGSVSSTNRQNQDDHLQVLCVAEVDTMDQDLHHEHERLNSAGAIDCGEEIQEYSMCNTGLTNESRPQKHKGTDAQEKRFACPECHKRFTRNEGLMRHMEVHIPVKPHKCSLCGKKFSSEGRLSTHVRGHTAGRFECSYCNKGFKDSVSLARHIRTHTGEKPFKCSVCDKSFSVKGNLGQHLKNHRGEKPFTCTICDKRFLHQSGLSRHMYRTHSGTRIKPFQCCVCDKSFSQNSDLTRHMQTHTRKKFPCSYCNKILSTRSDFESHERTHVEEVLLPKEFSSEGRLSTHVRGHTAGRSFECPYCDKGFKDSCSLTRHIRTHTGEKPFKCSVCDKLFSVKGNLVQHLKTHGGDKPFTCAICDKSFSQNSDLTRHMQTHTKGEQFPCFYCNKILSTRSNFESHERTHVAEVSPSGS
ncbi:oocyte zinc finger protein XlCOF6 isoform X1 [Strongylocentrotus purpuratus]|uniref:C2H2-type domain-containing protein n=1 Tax=Strongylocentrotus purpuratus TaxID=7668 RepID=A0A7M7PA57_STRPU|nr:oocyte zinc finger protein XlCOF6 isoform X1 [Strongylocentrotus purpuratus]